MKITIQTSFLTAFLLMMGVPAAAEWRVACEGTRCQLLFEILDADKRVQSRIYFHHATRAEGTDPSKDQAGSIIAIASVPLGIFLPAGIDVKIDDKSIRADLVDCTTDQGCRAAFEVDTITLDQLKAGKQLSLVVQDQQNQRTVTFNFGLVGFSKAYGEFLNKL